MLNMTIKTTNHNVKFFIKLTRKTTKQEWFRTFYCNIRICILLEIEIPHELAFKNLMRKWPQTKLDLNGVGRWSFEFSNMKNCLSYKSNSEDEAECLEKKYINHYKIWITCLTKMSPHHQTLSKKYFRDLASRKTLRITQFF